MADNDLDILDPTGRNVTVAGRMVSVLPLTIGQLPRFVRAIQPALPMLAGKEDPDWLALVGEHGEALIEAAAIATGLEVAEIEVAAPDEFVLLCGAIFEVNTDFFVRRLAPALQSATANMEVAMQTATIGAGAIPSTLS